MTPCERIATSSARVSSFPRESVSIQARWWLARATARIPMYSAILPNIAARVQSAAEPGTVVITDAVHRLVSGLFVVEDRGA
jgi:hypothetical protein